MENIQLNIPTLTPLSPLEIGFNLSACLIAAFLLRYIYVRWSISLSGKFHIGSVIPILALVTFLVIMIVKTSLALSLGLVGALSIVRFRTPIKEPEELIYLFLSIALGLGYGAGQTVVTSVVFGVIILVILIWSSRKTSVRAGEFNLMVDWHDSSVDLESMISVIVRYSKTADLKKFNSTETSNSLFVSLNIENPSDMASIDQSIKKICQKAVVSFSESRPLQ